jgi:hypothetical protein
MTIKQTEGGIIIDGEHIKVYQLMMLMRALRFEVSFPGMKASRFSLTRVAQRDWGCKSRTKKGCMEELEVIYARIIRDGI